MSAPDHLPIPSPIAPPVPPKPPVPGECCERGCELCMWDYYDQAQRRYEAAYAEWRQQSGCAGSVDVGSASGLDKKVFDAIG